MNTESYAIEVQNVVKKFRIYHKEKTIFDRILNIAKRDSYYEELMVLNDISFKANRGEMIGIIGQNGSGKTTLLRLIARIMRPTSGTIRTEGSIVPLLELGTGFDGDFSARDNIVQYGIILGFGLKQIKARVEDILAFAELEKFGDTYLRKFSTGMTARLAFSTAAQVEPDILLVDEVLSVGDISFQQKSYRAFRSFKEQKKTILFVAHNLESIKKLCDRVILLHNGKIHSIGEPESVIDAYLSTLNFPRIITEQVDRSKDIESKENTSRIILEPGNADASQAQYSVQEVKDMIDNRDFEKAIICLKPMLTKEPTNGQVNYFFAFCLHCSKMDYARSLHHYNLALKYGFPEFWVRYGRGSLYREIGDTEAATVDLERAVALDPFHDGPRNVLDEISKFVGTQV
ncbi:MAG: ABC transporter ATP-binding protein [Thermoproteota archaeon]|nr:ABC transporter ATP-binding protein [Thermoproteota archaeon]